MSTEHNDPADPETEANDAAAESSPTPDSAEAESASPPGLEGHDPAELIRAAIGEDSAPHTPPGKWEPPLPEEVSAMLEGYEVTGVIGRGGMGAVYKGIQTSLARPVAIKLLPPELGANPEFRERFRREAQAMAQLNHPHIVQIYDFGETEQGHCYFVMEYVEGKDFHQILQNGRLDAEATLNTVMQICDALHYAHSRGFVHRDIKPANIYLNTEGILKVGDFGLAKVVDGDDSQRRLSEQMSLTAVGTAMGTPQYVAPEQVREGAEVDGRADLYSLGVMFYEMLTGEIPRGRVKRPSKKITKLDVRIDGVVFKAMESDPDERYQSAVDLRHDVDVIRTTPMKAIASDVGDRSPVPENAGKTRRSRGRAASARGKKMNPSFLPVLMLVPVLVLGGVVVSLISNRPDQEAPDSTEEVSTPQPESEPANSQPAPGQLQISGSLKRGLLIHYGFDAVDPKNKAFDKSPNKNHGFVTGKAHWIDSGKVGGGFDVEGGAVLVQPPLLKPENETFEATVAGWFNVKRMQGRHNECALFSQYQHAPNRFIFNTYSWHPTAFKGNSKDVKAPTTIPQAEWCFLALTRARDGTMTIFVNGRKEASGVVTGTFLDVPTSFGSCKRIDEIAAWDRVLSDEEIEQFYRLAGSEPAKRTIADETEDEVASVISFGDIAKGIVLLEPVNLELGKGNGPRTKTFRASIPLLDAKQTFLRLQIQNGSDDSGDRGVVYRVSDSQGEILKEGSFFGHYHTESAEVEVTPGDEVVIELEDLDTVSSGSWGGNALTVQVNLITKSNELKATKVLSDIATSIVLLEPLNLMLGKGDGPRTKTFRALIPSLDVEQLVVKIFVVDGADDSGDRGVVYRVSDSQGEILKKGSFFAKHQMESAEVEVTPGDEVVIELEDLDTVSSGSLGGNTVSVQINLAIKPHSPKASGTSTDPVEHDQKTFTNGIGQEMIWVPSGSFRMGDLVGDGWDHERPVRTVELSGYYLGATEVTHEQWLKVFNFNPSAAKGDEVRHLPIDSVSWNGAMEYCRKLTEMERQAGRLPDGWAYTLPTEAQWEYACRAGTEGHWAGDPNEIAWYDKNSGGKLHPVATKKPNKWGFYDMHGNLREWCLDWYGPYDASATRDPQGPATGKARVMRGGSYGNWNIIYCHSAHRRQHAPAGGFNLLGFRVAMTPLR